MLDRAVLLRTLSLLCVTILLLSHLIRDCECSRVAEYSNGAKRTAAEERKIMAGSGPSRLLRRAKRQDLEIPEETSNRIMKVRKV